MQATLSIDAYSADLAGLRLELESLRRDNGSLRKESGELQQENGSLRKKYEALCAENKDLHAKHTSLTFQLNEFRRLVYGAKSERFVPQSNSNSDKQLDLFPEAVAPVREAASADETHTRLRRERGNRRNGPRVDARCCHPICLVT